MNFGFLLSLANQYISNKLANLATYFFESKEQNNKTKEMFDLSINHPHFEGNYFAHYKIEAMQRDNPISYFRDCTALGIALEYRAKSSEINNMDSDLKALIIEIYENKKLKTDVKYKSIFKFDDFSKIRKFHFESLKKKLGKYVTPNEKSLFKILNAFDIIANEIYGDESWMNISELSYNLLKALIFIEKEFEFDMKDIIKVYLDIVLSLCSLNESDVKLALTKESLEYKNNTSVFGKLLEIANKIENNYFMFFEKLESDKRIKDDILNELVVAYAVNNYNALIYMLKTIGSISNSFSESGEFKINKDFLTYLTTGFIHGILSKTDLKKPFFGLFSSLTCSFGSNIYERARRTFFLNISSLSIYQITNLKNFDPCCLQYELEVMKYAFENVIEQYTRMKISKIIKSRLEYQESFNCGIFKNFKGFETILKTLCNFSCSKESMDDNISKYVINKIKTDPNSKFDSEDKILKSYFNEFKNEFNKYERIFKFSPFCFKNLSFIEMIDGWMSNEVKKVDLKPKTQNFNVISYLKYIGLALVLINFCIFMIKLRK